MVLVCSLLRLYLCNCWCKEQPQAVTKVNKQTHVANYIVAQAMKALHLNFFSQLVLAVTHAQDGQQCMQEHHMAHAWGLFLFQVFSSYDRKNSAILCCSIETLFPNLLRGTVLFCSKPAVSYWVIEGAVIGEQHELCIQEEAGKFPSITR